MFIPKTKGLRNKEKRLRQQFSEKLDELARLQPEHHEYQNLWDQTTEIIKKIDVVLIDQAHLVSTNPIQLLLLKKRAPRGLKAEGIIDELIHRRPRL